MPPNTGSSGRFACGSAPLSHTVVHEVGAAVTADGKPHHPYAVFINARTGKRGLVVCNYDEKKTITAQVTLNDGGCPARYRLVDDPTWRATADGIVLPPCSAVVVID